MITFLTTLKGASMMAGISFASIAGGALADIITQDTPVTLGSALGVGGVVCFGAWYLSSRLQRVDDHQKHILKRLETIEHRLGIKQRKKDEDEE